MNTISASASRRAAVAKVTPQSASVRALAERLAPRDHAGKGSWDNNADIPPLAWFGAVVFALIFLVILPWLGHGASF